MKKQAPSDGTPEQQWEREQLELSIARTMFHGLLKNSVQIERFCTWALVISAGIASFMIANAESISSVFGKNGLISAGIALMISCIAGLASKLINLKLSILISVESEVTKSVTQLLENYHKAQINENDQQPLPFRIEKSTELFVSRLPRLIQWRVRRKLKSKPLDPLDTQRQAAKLFSWQIILVVTQSALLFGFFTIGLYHAIRT